MQVVEEHYDSMLRHGLVEWRSNLDEGVVRSEGISVTIGTYDWNEAFGGDVIY